MENESCSEFDLESDQLAFKGNEDYQALLNTVCRLEALREKVISDLDRLYELKNGATEASLEFVRKLQNDPKSLNIPIRCKIPEIPAIDWSKYAYTADLPALSKGNHTTRGKKINIPQAFVKNKPSKPEENQPDVTLVRGRVKDETKPETFNQLWTSEEQRRLEELLVEFPPERIEARRYRKIADRLGTKTLQQVASRIQKYFIRLAQSGLPIPGRMPSLASIKRKVRKKHHVKNKAAYQSSFLQAHQPPVYMPDNDDMFNESKPAYNAEETQSESSDSDDEIPEELKTTDEYKELMNLKAIRALKTSHIGFKCDGCGQEPIIGTRYHCTECVVDSIDFCSSCYGQRITLAGHSPSHLMVPVDTEMSLMGDHSFSVASSSSSAAKANNSFKDVDYLSSKFNIPGHYNYLDPNYMPDLN